ncbi:MAG: hypothetical protein Q9203_004630 [Teloschistes exilis]
MYFNALIITGLAAALVNSEPACGPLSFVTVTVNAPPVTKTLAPPLNPFPPAPDGSTVPAQTAAIPEASSEATTTLSSTSILTTPNFVTTSNVQDLGLPQDGSFSFAVVDSTTTWLGGKTPDSSAELVTNTRVVTIVPQPVTTPSVEHALAADGDTTTSYTTISSTSYYTHRLTAGPLPAPTSLSSPTPNFLPYLGHKGWNTTLTTLQKLRSGAAPSNSWPTYTVIWATSVKWVPNTSLDPKPKQARQTTPVLPVSVGGVVTSVLPASAEPSTDASYVWQSSFATSSGIGEQTEIASLSEALWTSAPTEATTSQALSWSSSFNTAIATSEVASPSSTQSHLAPTAPETPLTLVSTKSNSFTTPLPKATQPTPAFSNVTQTTPEASAPTTSCGGDTGHFTIDFDDLPHFSVAGSNNTDIPPIFNPYRKLFFNAGYGYVPPPSDPYAPISPPQLAVWNVYNDSIIQHSVDAGLELRGEIGAGPRFQESAYWIDAYSVWIGCANSGPTECRLDFIGFDQFDAEIATQTLLQPPCPGLVNCKLVEVEFSSQFRDLAGLQILAYVNKTPIAFYMDDLSLGWSNNTCAAQLQRSSAQ